jgi:hypothetical protein
MLFNSQRVFVFALIGSVSGGLVGLILLGLMPPNHSMYAFLTGVACTSIGLYTGFILHRLIELIED